VAVDKRQLRKERRYVQSESRWMQKALFAIGKAQDARAKLQASREDGDDPITISIGDESVPLESVRDGFEQRVEALASALQERRQVAR